MQRRILINDDLIIGNILAYAKSRDTTHIHVDKIVKMADEKVVDYNISVCRADILNFVHNYPFFLSLADEDIVRITCSNSNSLMRYFRVGFYSSVLLALERAFSEVVA